MRSEVEGDPTVQSAVQDAQIAGLAFIQLDIGQCRKRSISLFGSAGIWRLCDLTDMLGL